MKWFLDLKIAAKLIICFVLVALLAGIVGGVGIYNIVQINNQDSEMYEHNTAIMDDLAHLMENYQRERACTRDLLINKDAAFRDKTVAEIANLDKEMDEAVSTFEKGTKEEEIKTIIGEMKANLNTFRKNRDEAIDHIKNNQDAEANSAIYVEGVAIAEELQAHFDSLISLKEDSAKKGSESNDAMAKNAIYIMIGVIAAGMIIAVALGVALSRMIGNPMKQLVVAADKLALGDVNVNVQAASRDEVGNLTEAFGKMITNIRDQALAAERIADGDLTIDVRVKSDNDLLGKKLGEMVEKNNEVLNNVINAAEQVAVGARQVSASSQALSQGSTEQASSIEEISASLEQLAAQTKVNATSANQANELASMAKDQAVQGNMRMAEMIKAMAEINESSNGISKIIKVIDDIAFQTNILALNAAVEAARAGQHGKGFAVVAEEVRNLAARSADAAKETTAMIEGSIKKVDVGTRIANDTAQALNQIVEGSSKSASLVGEIAIASNEQASGIAQINQAIVQVSQVVQNNTATSEESAAASEEMSGQAEMLKDLMGNFKLKRQAQRGNINMLSPELLAMLEEATSKRNQSSTGKTANKGGLVKSRVILDDTDFGKYTL